MTRPATLVTTADSQTESLAFPVSLEKLEIHCLALAPLRTRRSHIGLLVVGKASPDTFSREDEIVLTALGGQFALGIENIRLYQQREQYSEQLEQQNELILDAAGEGIYGLDCDGNTTFVNPAAVHMLGWTPDELMGKPAHDVHHHSWADGSPNPRTECPIYAAFKDGKVHQVDDEVFWCRDGSSLPVAYTSTPIYEYGELIGAVSRRQGRFELAHGGTIFLDEIGDLPLKLQAKLLPVLQEGEFERLGDSRTSTLTCGSLQLRTEI